MTRTFDGRYIYRYIWPLITWNYWFNLFPGVFLVFSPGLKLFHIFIFFRGRWSIRWLTRAADKANFLSWEWSFMSFQSASIFFQRLLYHLNLCDRSLYFSILCDRSLYFSNHRSGCKSRLRWHDRSATRCQLRWPPDGCIVLLIFIHILYIVIVLLLLTECIINSGDHQLVAFCDDWILIHLNDLNPFESIWIHLDPFE